MKISVYYYPSTWILADDTFYCIHEDSEIVTYTEQVMGFDGPYEVNSLGYACLECGEPLEGSPELDREEALADC